MDPKYTPGTILYDIMGGHWWVHNIDGDSVRCEKFRRGDRWLVIECTRRHMILYNASRDVEMIISCNAESFQLEPPT